jgi:hypothetical protein
MTHVVTTCYETIQQETAFACDLPAFGLSSLTHEVTLYYDSNSHAHTIIISFYIANSHIELFNRNSS